MEKKKPLINGVVFVSHSAYYDVMYFGSDGGE